MEEPDVSNMEGYFGRPVTETDFARISNGHQHRTGTLMSSAMDPMTAGMMGGDTLDDIVMQNQKEMQRQRSMHHPYGVDVPSQQNGMRRAEQISFGQGNSGELHGFQFHLSHMSDSDRMAHNNGPQPAQPEGLPNGSRRRSTEHLALDTQFANLGHPFDSAAHQSSFQSPLNSSGLDLNEGGPFSATGLSARMASSMSVDFPSNGMQNVPGGEGVSIDQYAQSSGHPVFSNPRASPLHPSYPDALGASEESGRNNSTAASMEDASGELMLHSKSMPRPERVQGPQSSMGPPNLPMHGAQAAHQSQTGTTLDTRMEDRGQDVPQPSQTDDEGFRSAESASPKRPDERSLFQGIYSASGFDMVKVLTRVAGRKNPEINIGAVDMSCAFVVCDVTKHDLPIVYCSDVFERLTGYHRHEILGRNCRFLQAPNGEVQSGVERKYVDDDVVLYLKNKVTNFKEAQTSLINYRKGGQPFMNLLTIIPIPWDTDAIQFYVGFQVDLVETPQSVTNKNPDGSYAINYQRGGYLPRYVWQTPENNRNHMETGQTIPRDDVSTVLSTIGTGESELSKRIWDKVLLENTDDVVHVLSLKGLFLYLSPSSRKILEYDSSELVGTALSSVCHPSDIVPVTRELKDTSTGASVNVVFRIRRKNSGYTWFESHGSLHTEQGKGRKCIILVGRERPVYALSRNDMMAVGGIGECELWTKMSTSGMFLFVSSNVKNLLDRTPEEMVGTSIQALMRSDSKIAFGRVLELARTGKRTQLKHEMQNRRGQVLQAHTTVYPGDADEGQKPTFFVAQTTLLKLSRSTHGPNGASVVSPKSTKGDQAFYGTNTSGNAITPRSSSQDVVRHIDPSSGPLSAPFEGVTTRPGGSGLPIGTQDIALASDENVFDELKTTRSTSWQFELRQMEKRNRLLAEELQTLLSSRKKRKRRKGAGQMQKDCANCHTRVTPEWRRGPSGNRDLCNSCGLRWAKQNGRASPRTGSQHSDKQSASPVHSSPVGGDGLMSAPVSSMPIPERKSSGAESPAAYKDAAASQGYGNGDPNAVMTKMENSPLL
ncbi:MAG: blue light receptor [Piccolia ochrophora]|nr:MAG: blue light receptor [Piccolia ochrophora]